MRHEIKTHLIGTKNQYYILRVYQNDRISYVHTSKDLSYLMRLLKERYSK